MSYIRYILDQEGRIKGLVYGETKEAVLNTKLPDGIEHIEQSKPIQDVFKRKAKMRDGRPILDQDGKIQLVIDKQREIDEEIAQAKEETLLELIKPRLSPEARARVEAIIKELQS